MITHEQSAECSDIAGTSSAEDTPESSHRIEVARSDRIFEPFSQGSLRSTEGIRYVRVHDASGLSEICVYGSRSSTDSQAMSLDVARNLDGDSWSFSIPAEMLNGDRSGEYSVKIFDITGRLVWSGSTRVGDVLHWDGCSNGNPVPSGVYLLQSSIGSDVSTGSLMVMRN